MEGKGGLQPPRNPPHTHTQTSSTASAFLVYNVSLLLCHIEILALYVIISDFYVYQSGINNITVL